MARLPRAVTDVDWKSFRDLPRRGAKDAVESMSHIRRGDRAESRSGVMLVAIGAAVGAAFMYFFDGRNGRSRRSSARVGLKRWYRSGRGHIDGAWRQLQADGRVFDRTRKARTGDDPGDLDGQPSRRETAAAPH